MRRTPTSPAAGLLSRGRALRPARTARLARCRRGGGRGARRDARPPRRLPVHVAHVSTAGTVEVLRWAKAQGIAVTAEVTPHHLLLTTDLLAGYDPTFKVNPPLRPADDVEALREALADGTIDAVATDHAPHARHDKEHAFVDAAFGMLGLETALPVVATVMVETGRMTWADVARVMSVAPARIAGLADQGAPLAVGHPPTSPSSTRAPRWWSIGRSRCRCRATTPGTAAPWSPPCTPRSCAASPPCWKGSSCEREADPGADAVRHLRGLEPEGRRPPNGQGAAVARRPRRHPRDLLPLEEPLVGAGYETTLRPARLAPLRPARRPVALGDPAVRRRGRAGARRARARSDGVCGKSWGACSPSSSPRTP